MFNLDERPEQSVRIITCWTRNGPVKSFRLPDGVPESFTFSNRRLTYIILQSGERLIGLDDEIMRALDWKEGDEISWTVYSDRTNFFKVST